ncbi:uncharacterized protein SPPG_06650 [Spizellomyces punctatus DAOM BR117]|uniref:FH2 domain-containing protein n=1 Tax=Spizellomyces punctatus (strain DAOM BR117) TaxID=645134 RepID=A0A0L0HBD9_SPIPD|nr:uncharacterized protein SPPG_06650 [Spizellomyces punctatus DAOM BR117]KNC98251.1 hypothetical protein SPPG_06650 [Spizellomyces punctatus DAOM BR117]|eukprot:XP_016606291.1 hypothetical protein SPPG_06650 [Spizellomyces punctatus DAOM BR117]
MVQRAQFTNLLDLRRANNVSIGLSRFTRRGLGTLEIVQAVRTMDVETLSADDLTMVQKLLPTPEERLMLHTHLSSPPKPDAPPLAPAEQFMIEMMQTPDITEMVTASLLNASADHEVTEIVSKLDKCITVCEEIKTSEKLKVLLRSVLELGNLTNYEYSNGARGGAGFRPWMGKEARALGVKVDGLARLRDVKSADGKWSLMSFLVDMVERSRGDVLDLPSDFSLLKQIRHYDMRDMVQQMRSLESTLARLQSHTFSSDPTTAAYVTSSLQPFFARMTALMATLASKTAEFKTAWKTAAKYLGEDLDTYVEFGEPYKKVPEGQREKKQPTHVFIMLELFFRAFEDAVADNLRRKREEARRKRREVEERSWKKRKEESVVVQVEGQTYEAQKEEAVTLFRRFSQRILRNDTVPGDQHVDQEGEVEHVEDELDDGHIVQDADDGGVWVEEEQEEEGYETRWDEEDIEQVVVVG